MNTLEACDILGVAAGASKDEVKSAFKRMAVKYHPDRNKSEGAEEKFKEINEAFQLIDKYGTSGSHSSSTNQYSSYAAADHLAEELRRKMEETFGFGKSTNPFVNLKPEPVIETVQISFKESVLGLEKEVPIKRRERCGTCKGTKKVYINKKMCPKCGGNKYRSYGGNKSGKKLPCVTCDATGYVGDTKPCATCMGLGTKTNEHILKVKIPARSKHSERIVVNNAGHWQVGEVFGNVVIVVGVSEDMDMHLDGSDVISVIELSLLEALQGAKKRLRTINGERTLAFKPMTKNRDTIRVKGFGVPPDGAHVFVINVNYPEDADGLIEYLSGNDGYQESVENDSEPND